MASRSQAVAEMISADLRRQSDQSVPVDLQLVAGAVGVRAVNEVEMIEDGRVRWTEDGPVIEINPSRPADRQRFTLAHELAHVALGSGNGEISYRGAPRVTELDEERLCDAIAAALLMPAPWIVDTVGRWHKGFDLNLVRLVAGKARVSMSAAAARITDVTGELCALVRWTRVKDTWVCSYRSALPIEQFDKRIRMSSEAATSVSQASRSTTTWGEVVLLFDDARFVAHVQLSLDARGCLMLITSLTHE